MVVCNTSIIPVVQPSSCPSNCSTSCAGTPAFPCGLGRGAGSQCTRRYHPRTVMSTGRSIYAPRSHPPLIQGTSTTASSSPPNGTVMTCTMMEASNGTLPRLLPAQSEYFTTLVTTQNGVITSNSIPSLVPFHNSVSTVPYNQTVPTATLMPCNSGEIQCNPAMPCNQTLYTCSVIPVVNGTPMLQCSPGVCQMQPGTVLQGAVEMCSITPPPPLIPSNPVMYPLNQPPPPLQPNMFSSATADTAWRQSYGMEQVWESEFKGLFSYYTHHTWLLLPVVTKPVGMWNANVDSAKVRFCCEDCGHGWTSMKGRVGFWFILNYQTSEGMVCLKLYGQQCDRCKTGKYEPAMWYPEEVLKVLVNIYNKVGQVYYGFQQAPYHKTRRPGKPRTPHNSELCQACKDGVCSERR